MKKHIFSSLCLLLAFGATAQTQNVGIGTISPDASAQLDVTSTTKGLLPPRMTQAQMNAISSPAEGLIVYCTDCNPKGLYINDGTTFNPAGNANSNSATVASNCNANGFTGDFLATADNPGRSFSVTVTNNSFSSVTINFSASDLVLSGVSGMTVGTPTGVPALSSGNATLAAGGSVVVSYPITGAPAAAGTLTATWTKLTLNCVRTKSIVTYDNFTTVADITSTTGKVWMDRNLGATQAATSSTDANAYGWLYQWGRGNDGHQLRTSGTTTTLSSGDVPGHSNFIILSSGNLDWRSPQNDNLWQGLGGTNNPCPSGYRIPTLAELNAERLAWSSNNATGAFASPLKLPAAGYRQYTNASFVSVGTESNIWSSTVSGTAGTHIYYGPSTTLSGTNGRAYGFSVRCIKTTVAQVSTLNCSGAASTIAYTGGNGGEYVGITVSSTGVTGLTLTVAPGTIASGSGSLPFTISGTPSGDGTASFVVNFGGQSCTLTRTITSGTVVLEVSTATGRVWMDRNMGATQAATSSTDANSYGWLYQWGRGNDGHQLRTSGTTATLSSTDVPGHSNFITVNAGNNDWRSPQNDNLWQGLNGTNNPCPSGFRMPTQAEFNAERLIWSSNNAAGAFASPLKLPVAGYRVYSNGSLVYVGSSANCWTSTVNGTGGTNLYYDASGAGLTPNARAYGFSARCIKN